MSKIPKPTLKQRMVEYLEAMRIQNFAVSTVKMRENLLSKFFIWCEERDLLYPTEITRKIVDQYQQWLYHRRKDNGDALCLGHQVNRLSAVRAFFKWMAKKHYILFNPAAELELPKLKVSLPKEILSIAEAEQVLSQPNVHEVKGIRDRAILEVFYSTGIRRMELKKLRTRDVDFEKGTLMVREGKGGKDRMIPIGDRALAWIKKYLQEVRCDLVYEQTDCGYLFLSVIQFNHPLSVSMLTSLISQYIKEADIDKVGSCHLFRHTMATMMLEHGADIRYIQAMLGHSKLDTTQIYTRVSIKRLKEIHNATHPAAFLKRPTA